MSFLCLLNHALPTAQVNGIEWEDGCEFERIWKEAFVSCFKVLSRWLSKRTEEKHDKVCLADPSGTVFLSVHFTAYFLKKSTEKNRSI